MCWCTCSCRSQLPLHCSCKAEFGEDSFLHEAFNHLYVWNQAEPWCHAAQDDDPRVGATGFCALSSPLALWTFTTWSLLLFCLGWAWFLHVSWTLEQPPESYCERTNTFPSKSVLVLQLHPGKSLDSFYTKPSCCFFPPPLTAALSSKTTSFSGGAQFCLELFSVALPASLCLSNKQSSSPLVWAEAVLVNRYSLKNKLNCLLYSWCFLLSVRWASSEVSSY